MKVSIITAVYNSEKTIEDCIKSIITQSYPEIEHIVIDGGSSDRTLEILERYQEHFAYWLSEKDKGFYDAINKGLKVATGDLVGTLNADDLYAHNSVIEKVVNKIKACEVDSCYGDLIYVHPQDTNKVFRYWKSGDYANGQFRKGWMPPHPTFFVRREIYQRYGGFNLDFKISADYELLLRFFEKHKISTCYLPEVLVKMRWGGKSNRNLLNLARKSYEDYKAWQVNNLEGDWGIIVMKNLSKIPQFFRKYESNLS